MDFFSRLSRSDSGETPIDISKISADDALIEALRSVPLFDDPTQPVPTQRLAETDDAGFDAADTDLDLLAGVYGPGRVTSASPVAGSDAGPDVALEKLLRAWRSELNAAPMPAPIDLEVAMAVVRSAPPRRRAIRPMIAVTAAIAGLLIGSTAIGARSATPESLLWPVTQLLWGDRADSVVAGLDVRKGIDQANEYLAADHPEASAVQSAASELSRVTVVITDVQPRDGRETLESQLQVVKERLESVTQATQPPATTTHQQSTTPLTTWVETGPVIVIPDPSITPEPSLDPGTSDSVPTSTSELPPPAEDTSPTESTPSDSSPADPPSTPGSVDPTDPSSDPSGTQDTGTVSTTPGSVSTQGAEPGSDPNPENGTQGDQQASDTP